MPEVVPWGDDERGLPVLVERAAADQVRAGPLQLDPRRRHQGLQGHLLLQPLYLLVGDAGHGAPGPQLRPAREGGALRDGGPGHVEALGDLPDERRPQPPLVQVLALDIDHEV